MDGVNQGGSQVFGQRCPLFPGVTVEGFCFKYPVDDIVAKGLQRCPCDPERGLPLRLDPFERFVVFAEAGPAGAPTPVGRSPCLSIGNIDTAAFLKILSHPCRRSRREKFPPKPVVCSKVPAKSSPDFVLD